MADRSKIWHQRLGLALLLVSALALVVVIAAVAYYTADLIRVAPAGAADIERIE